MSQQAMQQALRRLLWLIDNEPPVESISRSSWVNNWNVAVGQARASLDAKDAAALKEVPERLTLVDRFDVSGEVWLLLRPKGSAAKGDLVHGGGTIRVEGEFARALSTYFKERDAAMSTHQPKENGK